MTHGLRQSASERASSAEAFYRTLLANTTSSKKRANLERVWSALERMRKRKAANYTLAAVAHEIATTSPPSPAYQSLRNRGGVHFRQLIVAYDAEHGVAKAPDSAELDDEVMRALRSEPVLELRYRRLLEWEKALRLQVTLLKEQLSTLSARATIEERRDNQTSIQVDAVVEVYAVRRFLKRLPENGWTIGRLGQLLDQHGNELAPAGFISVLRKIYPGDAEPHDGLAVAFESERIRSNNGAEP